MSWFSSDNARASYNGFDSLQTLYKKYCDDSRPKHDPSGNTKSKSQATLQNWIKKESSPVETSETGESQVRDLDCIDTLRLEKRGAEIIRKTEAQSL